MRLKFHSLVFLGIVYPLICFPGDFKLTFQIENTVKPKIDTIDIETFKKSITNGIQSVFQPWTDTRSIDSIELVYKTKERKNRIRMDSIMNVLSKKYSKSIRRTDTCLILYGIDKIISLCTRVQGDEKSHTSYEIIDYQNGYLVVDEIGWESKHYILFNLDTRNYSYLNRNPFFINNSIAYCSDNYYGVGEFQLISLKDNSIYFGMFCDWEIRACYKVKSTFYLQFSNHDKAGTSRFIKVDFKAIF